MNQEFHPIGQRITLLLGSREVVELVPDARGLRAGLPDEGRLAPGDSEAFE